MMRLGRLGERFDNHGEKLEKLEIALDKMEETLSIVAAQKEAIQSIREQIKQNVDRTDETFRRIFSLLDRHQAGGRLS